jgi:hypothetical protein
MSATWESRLGRSARSGLTVTEFTPTTQPREFGVSFGGFVGRFAG